MPHRHALSAVRPDVASLGYGLFIATNATCMWGGLFPFLPPEIRDGGFMFAFYLVISLASSIVYALAALSVQKLGTTPSMPTRAEIDAFIQAHQK